MSHLRRAREVFDVEIAALKAVREHLDDSFDRAVETIVEALRRRGKVVVVGVGKSGNIGRKIAATLTSTGTTSVVLDSVDALHGDLGVVSDGDVVLAPSASTTAMLALGDALAMAILQARGFTERDFARHHPAGTIGRALLLKVSDIMRSGERNPVAPLEMTAKDGLLVMTRHRAGSLSIVDRRGRLVGVFTDGDLRRRMGDDASVLERALREVMTKNPVCLRDDALAAEALKIFYERNIDDLIVVNARKEPVGLVDLQDLPKMKLM